MDRVAVIGVGNLSRGDDAIGILAARRIQMELPDVHAIESSGDITHLLDCFREFQSVYIIDAISSGKPNSENTYGCIREFDATLGPLPDSELLTSSHALGLSQAIELARVLGSLPAQIRVFGVEGRNFEMREGLSRVAKLAVEQVAARIVKQIKS